MKVEFSRRSFMIILGVTTTTAVASKWIHFANRQRAAKTPEGICFFAEHCPEPAARSRTAAITYLPS